MVRASVTDDAASSGVCAAGALSEKNGVGDAGVDAEVPKAAREGTGNVARSQHLTPGNVRWDEKWKTHTGWRRRPHVVVPLPGLQGVLYRGQPEGFSIPNEEWRRYHR